MFDPKTETFGMELHTGGGPTHIVKASVSEGCVWVGLVDGRRFGYPLTEIKYFYIKSKLKAEAEAPCL